MSVNVLSLFDGISCGQVAFQKAGIDVHIYIASEINKDSMQVAMENFPRTCELGSVTDLTSDVLKNLLPKIDFLIGGSPCQDLSKAKSDRQGLDGSRSILFFEYARILKWIQENNNPDVKFLLENVVADPETVAIMTETLGAQQPTLIDSINFVPQRRKRLYWTNINDGVIPTPPPKNVALRDIIYDNNYKNFKDERIEKSKVFTKHYVKWDISQKGHYSQQDRAYYLDGSMCTMMKQQALSKLNIYLGDDLYRRCHPIEGERLQGLPDNYTSCIKSDNKRLGLCGDGWTVDVIAYILSFSK